MHNHYLINDMVEFHPATSVLRKIDEPDKVVMLNSPAARCFLLLIQKNGSIVSQQEFMDEVWKKSGVLVSPNTFYQNISILRKGLKNIGIDHELIITIPRIGLTLASDCKIRKLTTHDLLEINHNNAQAVTEAIFSEDEKSVAQYPPGQTHLTLHAIKKNPFNLLTLAGLAGILLLSLSAVLLFKFIVTLDEFERYQLISKPGPCQVFLSARANSHDIQSKALAYADKFITTCGSHPYIYIDAFPHLPRVSLLRCSYPRGEKGICISNYFVEDK